LSSFDYSRTMAEVRKQNKRCNREHCHNHKFSKTGSKLLWALRGQTYFVTLYTRLPFLAYHKWCSVRYKKRLSSCIKWPLIAKRTFIYYQTIKRLMNRKSILLFSLQTKRISLLSLKRMRDMSRPTI